MNKKTIKKTAPKRASTLKRHEELRQLGIRIKTARKLAGYRRAIDFKEQAIPNIINSRYYQWERGLRKPTDDGLRKISKFAGISFRWLKTGNGDPFEGVKIAATEKDTKKALFTVEMLAEKFAKEKVIFPDTVTDKLYKVAIGESPNKDTKIIYAINMELMQSILEELIAVYEAESIKIKPKNLSSYAAQIYADIVEHENNTKQQLKMVKIAASAYKRSIKK